jgi:DNA repair exonuclease SbcCD ATPase subunit
MEATLEERIQAAAEAAHHSLIAWSCAQAREKRARAELDALQQTVNAAATACLHAHQDHLRAVEAFHELIAAAAGDVSCEEGLGFVVANRSS